MISAVSSGTLRTWFTVLAVLLALGVGAAIVSGANASGRSETHCIQQVIPQTPARAAAGLDSVVGNPECFQTESEALAAAAQLGGGGAGGARFSNYVWYSIFKLWSGTDWTGSTYLFYSTTSCDGYYLVNELSVVGWNDLASSAAVYCGRDVDLWQHTYLGGSSFRVYNASRTLGALDNISSSWDTID